MHKKSIDYKHRSVLHTAMDPGIIENTELVTQISKQNYPTKKIQQTTQTLPMETLRG